MKSLNLYLVSNFIQNTVISDILIEINGILHQLITPNEEGKLFDEEFSLIVEEKEADNFVFNFGGKWYHTDSIDKPQLTPLKYVGEAIQEIPTGTFLGVRGCYELLNGSRLYKDWCKKAKFLGVKSLGICEKNTLAGTLKFQLECKKNEIKPILGATYTVWDDKKDIRYDMKCYVKDEQGWKNILLMNKAVNVDNTRFIYENDFLNLTDGLIIVADPKSIDFDNIKRADYYQLDTAEFTDPSRDKWYLDNLKKFFNSDIQPISICDAFYLDKEDSHIKQKLNQIGGFQEYLSKNQYFKSKQEYFAELCELFNESDDRLYSVFSKAVENEGMVAEECNFEIEIGKKHLPKYEMTEEEKEKWGNTDSMFWGLIEEGLKEKSCGKLNEEIERVEKEVEIIEYGNLKDYFLINYEQTKFCKDNDIYQGIGRGSSLGFLTSYLLDITKIHPFKYNLIAERFLTKERALNKIADIDTDIMQAQRDNVKLHLIEKYGYEQCCSVGTYTTMQLKGAFKDLAKLEGVEYGTANRISAILSECETISDIFKKASEKYEIKNFINKYPHVFNDLSLGLEVRKAKSTHASAFIILPKDKKVWEWIPVRKESDGTLVSEWEGYDLEDWGALKQDCLGLKTLDKFKMCIDLVRENKGVDIDVYNVPLNDTKVYTYLSNGWNEDVFQFGTSGLSKYCTEMNPKDINDLIAAVSLYRPGAMENNFHNEYILRKDGKKDVDYFYGTEDILKETYGLMCYQEDIMFICQKLGDFDLAETDEIRRGLGKKKLDVLEAFSVKFIDGAVKNGCPKDEAKQIWDTMVKFAGYSFNKSHAAAYATTGYISQWLKVNYPIEFWTTAFNMVSDDKHIPPYISEINKTGDIKVLPCNINISETSTKTDFKTETIYWALSAVKQVGQTSTDQIMEDRNKNGEYFSFEEFLDRHTFKGSKVNKSTIENLTLAGAFDEIEGITQPRQRYSLISTYRELNKVKVDSEKDLFETNTENIQYNWWWTLQQKRLSGIAFFDYEALYTNYFTNKKYKYTDYVEFCEEKSNRNNAAIAGYVSKVEHKEGAKGSYARITIENNYDFMDIMVWPEQYCQFEDELIELEKNILIINGILNLYRGSMSLQTCNDTQMVILR